MRTSEVNRKTNETDISLYLNIDGEGKSEISTGVGFLDHMLTLFAKHSGFDLNVSCKGDTQVDDHHSVEDIGIALGKAFCECVGDKMGIKRYGYMILPMDEALILTSADISGRDMLCFDADIPSEKIGSFDTELVQEFFLGFVRNAGVTLHIKQLAGLNSHHIVEGIFKSAAKTLSQCVAVDEKNKNSIPSTKGVL